MTYINFAMTTLLNGICQGAILAALMWILLKLLPRLNATTRFTVLWLTLLAVVALPGGLASPRATNATSAQPDSLPIATTNPSVAATFAPVEIRSSEFPESHPSSIPESGRESASQPRPESTPRSVASRTSSAMLEALEHPLIRIRTGKVLAAIEILWALLSLVMLVRLAGGYRELRRLKSGATPALDRWELRLQRLCAVHGIRRQTRLLISTQVAGPVSLGFLDPAILIPSAFLGTLSDAEFDHIVMHELAHLRRRDDWTNLAQRLIEAALPIQPAVYWLSNRMSLEREMACDDWVIAATGTAKPYAASLTKVAELSQFGPAGILAAGAAGSQSQLFRRVRHMLDQTRNAAPKLAFGPLVAAVAAVAGLTYLGTRAPQMVAFAQSPPNQSSQQEFAVTKAPKAPHSPQAPAAPIAALTPAAPSASYAPPTIAALPPSAPPAAQAAASPLAPPAPLAPSTPLAAMAPLAPLAPAVSPQSGETHMEFTTHNGWTSLKVKIDGAIEFTDNDQDVKSLSPYGHFDLEEGSWLSGRNYDVKADAAGNLTKTYSMGRTSKPLDDEGRAWLGRLLPQVIRETGIGAGPRVTRILRQGGPPAVIAEIGLIHSDGSRRIYLEQLFSQATLNAEQLKDSAKLIRGISSDGDKAQVLITVDEKYFTGDLRPYLFEAAESISSDGDKRRVLSDIVKKDAGNNESFVRAARAARHISSDGDKAEVLIAMAEPYRASDELHMVYFEAVNSISSDGDHARVLSKLLQAHGDDSDTLARVLRSAEKISSDGDKARVLKEAVSSYRDDSTVQKAFLDAANSISSDGDHQQVLVALVHRQGIGPGTLGEIANSAQRISSDGDKAHVLVDLAGVNIEPVRDAFFAAADSIHSDGDRSRVLTAVLDKPGTSSAMAIAAIQSATGISSEGDKARVLVDAANRYSNDSAVNAALRKAVASLHSDGEYRAVMSEIERHHGSI